MTGNRGRVVLALVALGMLWLPLGALAQTPPTAPPAPATPSPEPGFWEAHGDKVLLVLITAIVTAFLTEPLKALVKRLGAWLDEVLQVFGWGFPKRYLRAMAERHRWLKLIGVYNRGDLNPPRLQEVYVSLRLATGRVEDSQRLGWNEILSKADRRLVVLGHPGAGKSTLLDYLVLVFTGHVTHPLRRLLGEPFPMLARLRDLGEVQGSGALVDLLRGAAPLTRVPPGYPERRLRRGGCLVMLDGLDEVLDERSHARAVEGIERLVADYPDNWYVVTCRVAGWRGQLPGFRTFEVQELTGDDIRRFIGAWCREVLRAQRVSLLGASPEAAKLKEAETAAYTEAGRRADLLWEALKANEGLLRIAGTPLILSLITLVHYDRVELPQGRAGLYEKCLDVLLDLWDRKDKNLPERGGPSVKEKQMVLKAIALCFLENDLLEADVPALERIVAPLLPRLKAEVTAAELIQQIHERSGILVEQALGRFGFTHRALHDYLAAASIVEHERDDLLLARVAEERWREVILIAAGLAPPARAAKLVEALLGRDGESGAELEIAGLTLAEDVQLGEDLRARIKQGLVARLTREESAGAFQRLAGALLVADLEVARDWMRSTLVEPGDPRRRQRVLELLPELGEAYAGTLRPLLVSYIAWGEEDVRLRAQAAGVLARLGGQADGETLETLRRVRQEQVPELKAAVSWALCELGAYEELGLVRVPAGEFLMGSAEGEAGSDERPQHVLYLPTFYIGKHPVMVEEFRAFVEASWHEPRNRDALAGAADHPVVRVTWHDALAYSRWHGFGLPSEAEWEKAARGTDGRRWPWGDEWREGLANTKEILEKGGLWRRLLRRRRAGGTTPVGRFSPAGDSPCGCQDMAGNVWEWTRSLWGTDFRTLVFGYPYEPGDGREDLEAPASHFRVVRGGSVFYDSWYARSAYRHRLEPDFRLAYLGFRVVVLPFTSGL